MKLYSGPLSLYTAKVRIALAEKAVPYERIEVGWSLGARYQPHHPDVVALNPKAEVPVLVDGDLVVYDSTQILEYLEERSPEPRLYPIELRARARARRLEAWADEIFFAPVWDLIDQGFYPGESGAEILSRARAQIAQFHLDLEKDLGSGPYLCGDFGVADLAVFVMMNAASTLGAPIAAERVALAQWYARVASRPAVAEETSAMLRFVQQALGASS